MVSNLNHPIARRSDMNKKVAALCFGVFVAAVSLFGINYGKSQVEAADGRDCTANSIINCGAYSKDELLQKYNQNATGDLPQIFSHYGIDMGQLANAKEGVAYKNGDVVVDGKVVATGAWSIGRQSLNGSQQLKIGGKTYYNTPNQSAFVSNSIRIFAFFNADGTFKAAIIMSCGNPLSATPTPPPAPKNIEVCRPGEGIITIKENEKKPTDLPKDSPECQPAATCDTLTATMTSRTSYRFTAAAIVKNGATITGYTYNFGDGQTISGNNAAVDHTYAKEGTYVATVVVKTSVGDKTSNACQVKVIVKPEPTKPEFACTSLSAMKIASQDRSYKYTVAYTVKDATLNSVKLDYGDGSADTYTPNQLENMTHTYANTGNYTTVATLSYTLKGSEGAADTTATTTCKVMISIEKPPVKDIEVCRPDEGIITIPEDQKRSTDLPKDSAECKTVPPELPKTGPGEDLLSALGLGSLGAAGYYYVASRRGLMSALLGR